MVAIAFIHPDLGIGGAERFVVDAAVALQTKGHEVHIFTSHHDTGHCFEETRDGTLNVTSVGDWLPRHTFGRLYALWAYIRMIYVAIYIVCFTDFDPDVVICDQVSACIPILKWRKRSKVLFYCHFPDLLLTQRRNFLKRIYRKPLEEKTTGMADSVLVNSKFTAGIFHSTFTTLDHLVPTVLYPSLNFEHFNQVTENSNELQDLIPPNAQNIFLSINRFERKKNLALAVYALKEIQSQLEDDIWQKTHLILAGGYDDRVNENKENYLELRQLSSSLSLSDKVTFVRSFSDSMKLALLKSATCLLYTPSFEHFGLVPLEAMYMECPVIACNSGGPLETVKHEVTGFLCDPEPQSFAAAMRKLIGNRKKRDDMGDHGRIHVVQNFSFEVFATQLDIAVRALII